MSKSSRGREPETQQCIHCGRQIRRGVTQCPYCREAQAEQRPSMYAPQIQTHGHLRHGLLLMLLSGVVHYFAGGYSPLALPGGINSPLLSYLVPLIFVCGLAMSLWGFFLRIRA